jgi:hypothetical protein
MPDAVPDAQYRPGDTSTDPGVLGGVDEPNEALDEPTDDEETES